MNISVGEERLAACLHAPSSRAAGEPSPLVICCHGLTGTRVGTCYRFVRLARRLEQVGIACLRFDFRGCGESGGRFCDVTADRLVDDLLAVITAAGDTAGCDVGRLGLVGSSFGAFTVAWASERVAGPRAAVFWAPVADPRPLADREMNDDARALLRRQGWLDHHGMPLGEGFLTGLPETDGPSVFARRPCPLLIFHGRGDELVPIEHGRAYESAFKKTGMDVSFREMDASDHGMRTVTANETILDGTVAWFRRFLEDT
ncbi:MAG: alpha/beta hydrolase family protein [Phycisphaerae bacterium]